MSEIVVKVPESVRSRVEHYAELDGQSPEEFVSSLLAQRIAIAEADSYVKHRAEKGSASRLSELLEKAPDVEPDPCDQIEN